MASMARLDPQSDGMTGVSGPDLAVRIWQEIGGCRAQLPQAGKVLADISRRVAPPVIRFRSLGPGSPCNHAAAPIKDRRTVHFDGLRAHPLCAKSEHKISDIGRKDAAHGASSSRKRIQHGRFEKA